MDDSERSMHASDIGSDVVADEAIVRAALAAHPWPRFGEGLQGRLRAIASTPPEASIGAQRDVRRPAADGAAAAPSRDVRGWRREAWASAVVLATVAVLALALAGTARVRQARPVEGPNAASPTPVATDVANGPVENLTNTSALSGRLIYFVPGEGDGNATVFALDMRTGRSERLWEVPGSDADAKWAISPDGSRLAYARQPAREASGLIYVRHLDAAAPEPQAMASFDADDYAESGGRFVAIDRLVWSPDSTALYYGVVHVAEAFRGAMPHFVRWELHRLTLDDSRHAGQIPPPPVGPRSWGINAGEDRVLARIEPDAIPPGNVVDLLAVDAANHRAAVAIGPGALGQVDMIALLDTDSGLEAQRLPIGSMEGLHVAVTADGARLAYATELRDAEDGTTHGIYELSLANAVTVTSEVFTPAEYHPYSVSIAAWSDDAQWLAWGTSDEQGNRQGATAHMAAMGDGRTEVVNVHTFEGAFVAFSPGGGHLLTATGAVLDLSDGTYAPPPPTPLPWPAPEGMPWEDAPSRVLGWIADVDRATVSPTETPDRAADVIRLTPIATVAVPPDPADVTVGPLLEVEDWSPDGRWLPFWTADRYDYLDPRKEAAQLHIYDTITGTVCSQPGAMRVTRSDDVIWDRPDEVTVRIDGVPAIGPPCGALRPAPESTHALPTVQAGETPEWAEVWAGEAPGDSKGATSSAPSPDGQFLATTTALDDDAHYETVITRTSDGQRVAATTWDGGGGFGGAGLGGVWLPSGDFILTESTDRGPLVLTTTGDVALVAERYFGLQVPVAEPYAIHINVYSDPIRQEWHLSLTGHGSVRLYHSELQAAETLPSDELWDGGLSRDGVWLMIRGRDGEGGSSGGLWIRGLDDRSTPFRQIPWSEKVGGNSAPYSSGQAQFAFGNNEDGLVSIVTFPNGVVVGRWELADDDYSGTRWSPDGRWIAIEGDRRNADGTIVARGLYIAPLPPEP